MTKILFICHGNICRSPAAEFIMRKLVHNAGREGEIVVSSAATSSEELGNHIYPPMKRILNAHGIDCSGKTARRMTRDDYDRYDLIIYMDEENRYVLNRFYNNDPEGKMHNLLDYAGRIGAEVDDPWYTRDFQTAWNDIYAGCEALLKSLSGSGIVTIDFSDCKSRRELYEVLRRELQWQDWYGENLDALWDILTGLPHRGESFVIIPPAESAGEDIINYASLIRSVFEEAEVLYE